MANRVGAQEKSQNVASFRSGQKNRYCFTDAFVPEGVTTETDLRVERLGVVANALFSALYSPPVYMTRCLHWTEIRFRSTILSVVAFELEPQQFSKLSGEFRVSLRLPFYFVSDVFRKDEAAAVSDLVRVRSRGGRLGPVHDIKKDFRPFRRARQKMNE